MSALRHLTELSLSKLQIYDQLWSSKSSISFIEAIASIFRGIIAVNRSDHSDIFIVILLYLSQRTFRWGGSIAQWIASVLPDPAAPGLNHSSGVFIQKNLDVA